MMRCCALVLLLAWPTLADTAVTVDGQILKGVARVDKDKLFLLPARRKEEKEYDLNQFYLVEKDDGTLVWASDFTGRMRAYEYLARSQRRGDLVKLVSKALSSKDAVLARQVFELAERDGYTGKSADSLKKRIEKLEAKRPKISEKKVAAVKQKLVAAKAIYGELLLARTRRALAADRAGGLRLLREVFRAVPMSLEGQKLLAAQVPKDFKGGDAWFWLNYHLDLEANGGQLAPDDLRELKMVRATWRKDLYGVVSGPMRLFTPVRDTRTVGRCIAYGKLTCDVLGRMFKTDKPMKRASEGLMVLLYSSKKEYMTVRGTGGMIRDPAELEWTTGYYSPADRLSRVYWHADRDAERRIARTFVHELTHHWLREYNPCYSDSQVRRSPNQPAYWIVEGFATFIEESQFDIDAGTWEPFDRRSRTLDVVQALSRKRGALVPWKQLFFMNQMAFRSLDHKTQVEFVRRWAMGTQIRTKPRLFYDQAAAACHFLYHGENGKYRQKLFDFVVAFYMGKKQRLDPRVAFGLPAEELGRRVEKFARAVADGWEPGRE